MIVDLIDAFAAAALDDAQWTTALRHLADATASSHAEVVGLDHTGAIDFRFIGPTFDIDDARLNADLAAAGGYDAAANFRIAAAPGMALLDIAYEQDYAAVIPRLASDSYVDFCRDYRISHGCQSILQAGADGFVGMSLLRSDADGPTTAVQRALLKDIAPHVRSATRIRRMLGQDACRLVTGMLASMHCAAFVFDSAERICGHTPAAERLIEHRSVTMRDGRLSGGTAGETVAIARAVHRAVAAETSMPYASVVVRAADPLRPLILDVIILPREVMIGGAGPRVAVIARDRPRHPRAAALLLQNIFGLSDAEAMVAVLMGRGLTREGIAAERTVSIHTVRTQIRTIFLKLGLARESELVTFINRLL